MLSGLLAAGSVSAVLPVAEDLAARVVILANSREPESVQLAEFYAGQRGVPAGNIVALPMPDGESVTWREFIDQIYQPLQDELLRRGWLEGLTTKLLDRYGRRRLEITTHRISYLVVCRGVPLRIYHDPTLLPPELAARFPENFRTNQGAVDSELSLLAKSGYEITASIQNPLFGRDGAVDPDMALVVKVARLDGPTLADARQLVLSALAAEQHGLLGRYYVDLKGPHADGDRWLEADRWLLDELGFDGETEDSGATFGAAARFDAPVFYFGWYAGELNGPFRREGFRFPSGAIALHIHSFSANTVRSATQAWCGPLVARGVTATAGNVFEPYLGLTHHPDLLLRALALGRTFGDAIYYALPVLSWQGVALGDPLYRPFRVTLDEQLRNYTRLPANLAPYAIIRQARLLKKQGDAAGARAALQAGMATTPHLALALALAHEALASGEPTAAVSALEFARVMKQHRPEDWPLAREIAALLAAHGARNSALLVYAALARSPAPSREALREMLEAARQLADAAGDLSLSLEFARQLTGLSGGRP